jgi:hypothetical protein
MRFATILIVVALVAMVSSSCKSGEDDRTCFRGDYRSCACSDKSPGFQACVDETSFGDCVCQHIPGIDATILFDAGSDAGPQEAGGLLAFMSPCGTDAQCESGLCFPFNAKGPHCSKACASDADCPPPADGCSNMKVCKAP